LDLGLKCVLKDLSLNVMPCKWLRSSQAICYQGLKMMATNKYNRTKTIGKSHSHFGKWSVTVCVRGKPSEKP
jgi:hypothetical protein